MFKVYVPLHENQRIQLIEYWNGNFRTILNEQNETGS